LNEIELLTLNITEIQNAHDSGQDSFRAELEQQNIRVDEYINSLMDKVYENLEYKVRDAESSLAEILEEALASRITDESKKLKKKLSEKLKAQYDEFTANIDSAMNAAKQRLGEQTQEMNVAAEARVQQDVKKTLETLTQQQQSDLTNFVEFAKQELDKCIERTELQLNENMDGRIDAEIEKIISMCDRNRTEDKLILNNLIKDVEKEVSSITQTSGDYMKSLEKSCDRRLTGAMETELARLQQHSDLRSLDFQREIQEYKQSQAETHRTALNRQQEQMDEKVAANMVKFRDELSTAVESKYKAFQSQLVSSNEQLAVRLSDRVATSLENAKKELSSAIEHTALQINASQLQCQQLVTQQAVDCSVELRKTCTSTVDTAVETLTASSKTVLQHLKDDTQQFIEDHLGKVEMEVKTMWAETSNLLQKSIMHELERVRVYDKDRMQRVDETLSYLELFAVKMERDFQSVEGQSNRQNYSHVVQPSPEFLASLPIQMSSDLDDRSINLSMSADSSPSVAPYMQRRLSRDPGNDSVTGSRGAVAAGVGLSGLSSFSVDASNVHNTQIEMRLAELSQTVDHLKNKVVSMMSSSTDLEKKVMDLEGENLNSIIPKLNESQLKLSYVLDGLSLLQQEHSLLVDNFGANNQRNQFAESLKSPAKSESGGDNVNDFSVDTRSVTSDAPHSLDVSVPVDHYRLETLQEFVNSLQAEVISMKAEFKLKFDVNDNPSLLAEQNARELSAMQNSFRTTDMRLSGLEQSVSTNSRDLESCINLAHSLNNDHVGNEQKLIELSAKIDNVIGDLSANGERLESQIKITEKLELTVTSSVDRLEFHNKQIEAIDVASRATSTDVHSPSELKSAMELLSNELSAMKAGFAEYGIRLASLDSKVALVDSSLERITTLESVLSTQQIHLERVETSLRQRPNQQHVDPQTEVNLAGLSERIDCLSLDIADKHDQLCAKVNDHIHSQTAPSNLENSHRLDVDRLQALDSAVNGRLDQLALGVTSLENDMGALKEQMRTIAEKDTDEVDQIWTELARVRVDIGRIDERFGASNNTIGVPGLAEQQVRLPREPKEIMSPEDVLPPIFADKKSGYDSGQDDTSFASQDEPDIDSVTYEPRSHRPSPFKELHTVDHQEIISQGKDDAAIKGIALDELGNDNVVGIIPADYESQSIASSDDGDHEADDTSEVHFPQVPAQNEAAQLALLDEDGELKPTATDSRHHIDDSFDISFENADQESEIFNELFPIAKDADHATSVNESDLVDVSGEGGSRAIQYQHQSESDISADMSCTVPAAVLGEQFNFDKVYSADIPVEGSNTLPLRRLPFGLPPGNSEAAEMKTSSSAIEDGILPPVAATTASNADGGDESVTAPVQVSPNKYAAYDAGMDDDSFASSNNDDLDGASRTSGSRYAQLALAVSGNENDFNFGPNTDDSTSEQRMWSAEDPNSSPSKNLLASPTASHGAPLKRPYGDVDSGFDDKSFASSDVETIETPAVGNNGAVSPAEAEAVAAQEALAQKKFAAWNFGADDDSLSSSENGDRLDDVKADGKTDHVGDHDSEQGGDKTMTAATEASQSAVSMSIENHTSPDSISQSKVQDDAELATVPVKMSPNKYAAYDVGMDDESFASSDDESETKNDSPASLERSHNNEERTLRPHGLQDSIHTQAISVSQPMLHHDRSDEVQEFTSVVDDEDPSLHQRVSPAASFSSTSHSQGANSEPGVSENAVHDHVEQSHPTGESVTVKSSAAASKISTAARKRG
jgi:hypothetical protein